MATKSGKSKKAAKNYARAGSTKAAAKASRAAKSASLPASPVVSDKQWDMPASFCADGMQLASLRDVVDPQVPTLTLNELSPEQRADLVANRIAAQKDFRIFMLGAGIIDKERAITEVKAQSKIGRALMEIEQRVINHLVDNVTKEQTSQ